MVSHIHTSEDTLRRVRKVLGEHAQLGLDPTTMQVDGDLYEAGMTSRASVNVMLGLEAEFDIEFPDAMLRRDVFESIASIAEAVSSLAAGR
ncbi:MAG: acyl carrier protein [Polyangiaceae bacterium]|nr:acyl carrier protein [Polyangiaceae bacterium]